ncbi:Phosphate-specific transport system accessory protein PhoU [Fundidesulfovibrio magnetotacticus]|uniref:Phosphate-specific transport system accessory protein PhoU n=1 Tax=Fundidesulfovibrio magnetotacticus TaxID=2730080 RepID=A0A6V8LJD2_9BACT|nr:phosphate signaling complex protein PhoU [Fundidesulfovibrio magnetotacticus]GFK92833.1 Phosphate-specific transport system accessory protein PhoU [Fundidesulfovibrio magnetotacticus]
MDPRFQKELEQLKVKVLQMAAYTDRALERALNAVLGRDTDLARVVIDSDREINAMECEVDNLCLRLLALDQPVAMDLRFIVASMRLVVDLERIGDEAVNIAEQSILLAQAPTGPVIPELGALSSQVSGMFRTAVNSFREQDIELARQVCAADSLADDLNVKVLKGCMELESAECGMAGLDRAIRTVMVARSMERVGDLATNIAEAAIFVVKGVSIKHHCQPF